MASREQVSSIFERSRDKATCTFRYFRPGCKRCVVTNPRMHCMVPRIPIMPCNRYELVECAILFVEASGKPESVAAFSAFFWQSSDKMTAQEQMKKMLDELMGTQRDGEYKICAVKVKLARYVSIEFEDTFTVL